MDIRIGIKIDQDVPFCVFTGFAVFKVRRFSYTCESAFSLYDLKTQLNSHMKAPLCRIQELYLFSVRDCMGDPLGLLEDEYKYLFTLVSATLPFLFEAKTSSIEIDIRAEDSHVPQLFRSAF